MESKASDDQWELFAAQLERERERDGEAIKRELALTVDTAEETEDTRGLDASGEQSATQCSSVMVEVCQTWKREGQGLKSSRQ